MPGRSSTGMLLLLDGQVGDAAARVEDEGRVEGAGGARVEAPRAGAAALGHGLTGVELQRGDDFAEKDHRAEAGHDEHAVLADEAEAGAHRPGALEDGLFVAQNARLRARAPRASGSRVRMKEARRRRRRRRKRW